MITSHYPNVSINTANPPTEMARQDAAQRNLFTPVAETSKSASEKPVASDDKNKAAGTQSAVNLYDASGKETETQQAVAERNQEQSGDESGRQDAQQNAQKEQKQSQQEEAEKKELQELRARDLEVKAHEQAHAAIGGRYAGAPSYSYEQGPDGKQYAVGGEVQIDISPVPGDPQATIQKMQQVKAAALAPAEPSGADRQIATEASLRMMQAQAELVQQTSQLATGAASRIFDEKSGEQRVEHTENEISYQQNSSGGISMPQHKTLAMEDKPFETQLLNDGMQHRRDVIAGFYQRATEAFNSQFSQQA